MSRSNVRIILPIITKIPVCYNEGKMKILIHYGELALKGKNRVFFEKKLVENIKRGFGGKVKVQRLFGRFLLETQLDPEKTQNKLLKVFGIAWFAECEECKNLVNLKKIIKIFFEDDFKTFAVRVNRVNKDFPKTSPELEKEIGEYIRKKHSKKVDLSSPDITFWVEILPRPNGGRQGLNSRILTFTKKIKGLQGLPVGVSGKLVSLLSGGIDSPVASYLMLKRGAKLVLVHFHSFPYLDKSSINKCQEILEVLREYQPDIKLHLVPFFKIQKKLKLEIDNRYLVIFYRRLMLKICQEIARKEKAGGLVTGESLGQVASQTLENLGVTNEVLCHPELVSGPSGIGLVLRPLIGLDKQEISDLAQKINTYKTSIKPQKDCCTLFVPKHPVTKARLPRVLKMEKEINLKNLLQQALKETEIV